MRQWLSQLDELLRGRKTDSSLLTKGQIDVSLRVFVPLAILLGATYGFFMGWLGAINRAPPNYWQLIASMVKLPALFILTLLVTLPSLYVFNALVGCKLSFQATLRLLIGAVVVNLAVAASFGTILGFFTLSTTSYSFMVLLNVVLLAIAGVVGLGFLLRTLQRQAALSVPPIFAPAPVPALASGEHFNTASVPDTAPAPAPQPYTPHGVAY